MAAYIVRRLLYAVLTLFGIIVVTFFLIHAVPGDPIVFYTGAGGMKVSHVALDAIRREYHLDKPLLTQFAYWFGDVVTLDFGRSIVDRRPAIDKIAQGLPKTLTINVIAFVLAAVIGIPIGLWSGMRRNRLVDRSSAVVFFLLYSLPAFWVALLLVQFFSVRLGILPLYGITSDDHDQLGAAARAADRVRHLVLPVMTLAYAQLAIFARFSRAALSEVIRQDFITAARAKGAGEGTVVFRHALRNALLPLITLLGLTIPYLLSGSVIVEEIFQWPGIGLLYFDSIRSRDYPTVMALTVVTAVVTLVASLLADLLYAFADPRIRLEEGGR